MTTPAHHVQGLDNDEVPADWPAISAGEIAWLQQRFVQLHGDCRLLWHSPRPFSAAALVEAQQGRFFIKRHHHSVRSAAVLSEEHRFIAHLAAHGVPVARVIADQDGATAVPHGDWTFEVHAEGAGQDLYRDVPSWTPPASVEQAWQAGRMLALLHTASDSFHAPQRATHLLVARDDLIRAEDPIALLSAQLPGRPGLAAYLADKPWQADLQRAILPWHGGLAARLAAEPRLWGHNDWHVSNLLWQTGIGASTVSTVLDFGLASPTSALYDLATAIERNAVAWLQLDRGPQAVRGDIALALLVGYRDARPLSADQVRLLADLLPVVHLDFALSEVEYFHAITGSRANADVAYRTFLLAHADWFRTPAGQGLLATLRGAA